MLKPIIASFVSAGMVVGGYMGFKPKILEDVIATAKEATVIVSTELTDGHHGSGAGAFINDRGDLVTAYHMIGMDTFKSVTVFLSDAKPHEAKVVWRDEKDDLAILHVDGVTHHAFLPIADSKNLRDGQEVVAIGNPFGLGISVSKGIVSESDRILKDGSHYVQTDAAVNHGNSGGPLIDTSGELVGVVDAIINPLGDSDTNYNIAVPSSILLDRLAEIAFLAPSKPEPVKTGCYQGYAP
jgi:S1-C subfamily serine protease